MGISREQRDWLSLVMVPGVGTAHFIKLLARFHTPENVLKASRTHLEEVVGRALAERILEYAHSGEADIQEQQIERFRVNLITLEDALYPVRLAEIYDPPLVLFIRGELCEEDEKCVAIVGTRRPTPYGVRAAEKFGRELAARGITVVSGMAGGIDTAAHRGAIEAGGRTIAVLGNGVDVVYPPQNIDLMDAIIHSGCVLSQFPMGTKPSKGHFPYRNRIISGLSLGTLVVEAPLQSGALITARHASEQGREVFAIPGPIGSNNSMGPHSLIRDGAKLVETVEDILVELELPATIPQSVEQIEPPPQSQSVRTPEPKSEPVSPPRSNISPTEHAIIASLAPDGSFVDEIAATCRIPVSEALSSLTILELKGLVRQFSGKRFAPR